MVNLLRIALKTTLKTLLLRLLSIISNACNEAIVDN